MDVNGSPEYALIWSQWDMPSGPPICRLRASGRRTSGKGFGGWPTASANDYMLQSPLPEHVGALLGQPSPRMKKEMAGWPTPMAGSPGTEDYNPAGNTDSSRKTVALVAGWATPRARDFKGQGVAVPGKPRAYRTAWIIKSGRILEQSHAYPLRRRQSAAR